MSATILIVDDEESVRKMLRRMLESVGYVIHEAQSGETGLVADSQYAPDLVLTDLKMPGMDGLTMSQQLVERHPDRPVLMMTAYADVESARKALQIGIYEYFIKPIDLHDLMAGIKRALEHRRLVLENKAYQKGLEQKVAERTLELSQKVEDLEARDMLLCQLLSIQEPDLTLGLAVKLSAGLCGAQFGVLYTPQADGYLLRAAFGFHGMDVITPANLLSNMNIGDAVTTQKILSVVSQKQTALILPRVDELRKEFGMGSMGVLPILKDNKIIAFLEVGKGAGDHSLLETDLLRLQGFLPYVAMAVNDCLLQESIPEYDVERLLNETEKWTQ